MVKRWFSYDEQVELLQERGLTVADTASAAEFLSRVNYSALEIRSQAAQKGYANGSAQLPIALVSELADKWDRFRFTNCVCQKYEERALNDLPERLHDLDQSIDKGNVARI